MDRSTLQNSIKQAMKEKDKLRLDTLRGLLSAIQYEEMEKKVDALPADAILGVIQRELKRRKEELDFASQAQRSELVEKFTAEIQILEGFLPSQLAAGELETIVISLKDSTPGLNMGGAMKLLKEKYGGQYDSKVASDVCRKVFG